MNWPLSFSSMIQRPNPRSRYSLVFQAIHRRTSSLVLGLG